MIIRLGLMDKDERYLSHLADYLGSHADESIMFELYLFSGQDGYEKFAATGGELDLLLATVSSVTDAEKIEENTVLAYLGEEKTMVSYAGRDVICKYQKAQSTLRAIQGLVAKLNKDAGGYAMGTAGRVILFAGSAGGVGCTTAAIGCAARLARLGRKVAYISYQRNAQQKLYFDSCGSSMSDVHYAYQEWLRMPQNGDEEDDTSKYRLQLRLKSMLATDPATGVDCFGSYKLPIDALDLTAEELKEQIQTIAVQYDDCVVDMDCEINMHLVEAIRLSSWTVLVSDGSEKGNLCMEALLHSLKMLHDGGDPLLKREVAILYTRFGKRAQELSNVRENARVLGKIPHYDGASEKMIIQDLAKCQVYSQIERAGGEPA